MISIVSNTGTRLCAHVNLLWYSVTEKRGASDTGLVLAIAGDGTVWLTLFTIQMSKNAWENRYRPCSQHLHIVYPLVDSWLCIQTPLNHSKPGINLSPAETASRLISLCLIRLFTLLLIAREPGTGSLPMFFCVFFMEVLSPSILWKTPFNFKAVVNHLRIVH